MKPESLEQLIENMTPEIYANLRSAVELGKWNDGSKLSDQQRELCMEAVILYEARNLPEAERVGAAFAQQCASQTEDEVQPISIKEQSDP